MAQYLNDSIPQWFYASVRQRNRVTATTPNNSVNSSNTAMGASADENPKPRQVMPSRPSIAHRVGTTTVSVRSHFGNTKVGTQAAPSIRSEERRVGKECRS